MKKTFAIALIILNNFAFSQSHNCNTDNNILKIYEFVQLNLDSIKSYTKNDIIKVSIDFKDAFVENTSYSVVNTTQDSVSQKTNQITVWKQLDTYIKETYKFCPSLDFESEENLLTNVSIIIPLKEDFLENVIEDSKNTNYTNYLIENFKKINVNNKFIVKVKKLNLGAENKTAIIKSELNYYNSDIIQIAPNYYLLFSVACTSENGIPYNELKYKLYKTRAINKSDLILKDDVRIDDNGIAELFFEQKNKINGETINEYELDIEIIFE
ncbi:hypothetical protein M0G43_10155 [Subsaxibacter sp. CAU 1640]|uniref:hypothetical protein n=1 Tax=Subsaxibacter sp. CAU 1640 TaxID=2933271 RepID=UPI002006A293|nr:hypothetical protein [Subsaxibacter sp. CAU 1640]MCK7590934.1 hypothetical protein [Subsaxibacter sp. CAU 1640]